MKLHKQTIMLAGMVLLIAMLAYGFIHQLLKNRSYENYLSGLVIGNIHKISGGVEDLNRPEFYLNKVIEQKSLATDELQALANHVYNIGHSYDEIQMMAIEVVKYKPTDQNGRSNFTNVLFQLGNVLHMKTAEMDPKARISFTDEEIKLLKAAQGYFKDQIDMIKSEFGIYRHISTGTLLDYNWMDDEHWLQFLDRLNEGIQNYPELLRLNL